METLVGKGELGRTRTLAYLLQEAEHKQIVLRALTRALPSLKFEDAVTVEHGKPMHSGAIPDIVISSRSAFYVVEGKLGANLTERQRGEYLDLVIRDPRERRALVFVVPSRRLPRYEREVAHLVKASTLRQA